MDFLKKDHQSKPKVILLKSYDPAWADLFKQEKKKIEKALSNNCVAIHHFGSTAVPGLRAKPVIDILAVVNDLDTIDVPAIEELGFEDRGEVVVSGRYFTKQSPHIHLHVFEQGNPLIQQNLDFRDWLRSHDEDRDAYALLKEQLAKEHKDGASYSRAKTDFCQKIFQKIRTS